MAMPHPQSLKDEAPSKKLTENTNQMSKGGGGHFRLEGEDEENSM